MDTTTTQQVGKVKLKELANVVPAEKQEKIWQKVPNQPSPDEATEKTLSMLEERLSLAKASKSKKVDIWNYSYLQYRSVNYYSMLYGGYPTYWNSWGMGVFIPRTFETIESIKTQMMQKEPDFTIEATLPVASKEAPSMHYLMKSEWNRSGIQTEVAETVHDCLLYGTGLIRTDVINNRKVENVLVWKQNEDSTFYIDYEQQEVQKYYGVGGRRVDPYDFFPNPSPEGYKMNHDKNGQGGIGWCWERSVVDAWDVREQYRMLKEQGAVGITDNWQYLKPGGDVTNYKYLREEVNSLYTTKADQRYPATIQDLVGRSATTFGVRMVSEQKGKMELWEYFEEDRYIVVAPGGLILRDSPNPFPHKQLPFVKYNLIDMNEFWSTGEPEIMRWLQVAENILYDQGLNNIIMAVHKMFAVKSNYLEDEGELVVRPFGIIHLKNIPNVKVQDAIMPIEYTHNMGNYFEFMNLNQQNIQKVTGVSDYQTGGLSPASNKDTATATNRLTYAGNARIAETSRHLEDSLVKGVVEQLLANAQFYYQNVSENGFGEKNLSVRVNDPSQTFFLKFLNKKNGEITDEDKALAEKEGYTGVIAQDQLQGQYNVTVKGGSSMKSDPQKQKDDVIGFMKAAQEINASSVNGGSTPVFDMKKIGTDAARTVFDVTNPDDYLFQAPTPLGGAGGGLPAELANIIPNADAAVEQPTA